MDYQHTQTTDLMPLLQVYASTDNIVDFEGRRADLHARFPKVDDVLDRLSRDERICANASR